jgi:hypothetical protein
MLRYSTVFERGQIWENVKLTTYGSLETEK